MWTRLLHEVATAWGLTERIRIWIDNTESINRTYDGSSQVQLGKLPVLRSVQTVAKR